MAKEDSRRHYDHIVVGAGINGCCAALQLVRRGASVLILEKVRPASMFDFVEYPKTFTEQDKNVLSPIHPHNNFFKRVAYGGL